MNNMCKYNIFFCSFTGLWCSVNVVGDKLILNFCVDLSFHKWNDEISRESVFYNRKPRVLYL